MRPGGRVDDGNRNAIRIVVRGEAGRWHDLRDVLWEALRGDGHDEAGLARVLIADHHDSDVAPADELLARRHGAGSSTRSEAQREEEGGAVQDFFTETLRAVAGAPEKEDLTASGTHRSFSYS